MLLDAVMRDCFLRFFVVLADEHFAAFGAVCAGERFTDGAAVFLKVAFDEREVEFVHFVFADEACKVTERVAVKCCNNHARSFLVSR